MRPSSIKFLLAAVLTLVSALPAVAQIAMPPTGATPFKDTSMLKPPAGAKVAVVEFEDLECGACAHAFPIVRGALDYYKIPLVHHDFIIPSHIWSREAAITARYLQDKVSPKVAEDFRRDVFTNQTNIVSKDDLQKFTLSWFQKQGQPMPFVLDPAGLFRQEVASDCTLGERLGVLHTPTILVVTAHQWIEVTDITQLNAAIERAQSQAEAAAPAPAARSNVRKTTTPAQ